MASNFYVGSSMAHLGFSVFKRASNTSPDTLKALLDTAAQPKVQELLHALITESRVYMQMHMFADGHTIEQREMVRIQAVAIETLLGYVTNTGQEYRDDSRHVMEIFTAPPAQDNGGGSPSDGS